MKRGASPLRAIACGCLALFLGVAVGAEESQEPQETLRVSVRLVTVNVRAAQPDGSAVRDLTPADFRLFEDDREKQIAVFEPLTAPLHVALLFDTSASTARDLALLRKAAERFLDDFSAADRFALYQVGPTVERLSPFTPDRAALKKALKRLQTAAGEGTLLNDALARAHRDFHPEARRRAVVVFSDGADEGSQATYEEVSLTLFRGHGSVFAVLPSLGPQPQPRASGSSVGGAWVVVFDVSRPGGLTLENMKQTFLEFLAELAPEARLRLYDCSYYLRPLSTEPVSPEEARAFLGEVGRPQRLGLSPRRVGPEKVSNLLILTDHQRTGLWRIAQYFDIEPAIIAVPDRIQPQHRREFLHLVVHRRAEYQLRHWIHRRDAAENMNQLASETGGEVWLFSNPRELTRTYRRVAEQIRSSYTLGYYS
ncbi:MAG: VWA domain-containing protein, partial [Candidatus Acidiferrales bacterium]